MTDMSASQTSSLNTTPVFSEWGTGTCTSSQSSTASPKSPDLEKGDLFPVNPPQLPGDLPTVPVGIVPDEVDDKDVGTPDSWLKRDPRLVRLTGKHPFNCEAKLDTLFDAGFITPTELFYVRNHGATPKVDTALLSTWKVSIEGLVANAVEFTIPELKARFETVTLPITLVCAGNRRKEQNVVRKGLGFNWGAGGVSTALFTGVYLSDVLDYVQPCKSETGERPAHVIFEGADELPNGRYGTSQLLSWARDKGKGMLVAWAMNGKALEPDHGFPIRVVIPGQIGGRSVKWLKKIQVSAQESQHYLHFWDNKLLPTQVMPEEARAEKKWWYDRAYLINELNTNSAIAKPDHDEKIVIDAVASYKVQGYAYAGGGRRVNRIEVSVDEGTSWKLAEITYPEDLYRELAYRDDVYGKLDLTDRDTCFCWCFWSFPIEMTALKESAALMVRAMDEGLSGQPSDMYWNATSMMNNWYFRVAIHKEDGVLRFEHPTMAGTTNGGWMERLKLEGKDILKPRFRDTGLSSGNAVPVAKPKEVSMVKDGVNRIITMEELKAHSGSEEPWFVVSGEVYDGTGFLKDHPGGGDSITLVAGEDATEDFMAIHSPQGKKQLAAFHIGTLTKQISTSPVEQETITEIEPIFLNNKKWKKGKLVAITPASHDSRVYRFALEREDQVLGLPVGQHVFVRLRRKVRKDSPNPGGEEQEVVIEGEMIQRAYTPVSQSDAKGEIDLLIKLYLAGSNNPVGGKMTTGFHELEIGEYVEFKGPIGSFVWKGQGLASWRGVEHRPRRLVLICAGSGITPILQVLRGVIHDQDDKQTEMFCIDSNRNLEDILCREELDELVQRAGGRLRLHHTLSKPPADWQGAKGRMTKALFENRLPPVSHDALVLVCGPDPLINDMVKPALTELGWNIASQLVVF